jgi:hypothetical protein
MTGEVDKPMKPLQWINTFVEVDNPTLRTTPSIDCSILHLPHDERARERSKEANCPSRWSSHPGP